MEAQNALLNPNSARHQVVIMSLIARNVHPTEGHLCQIRVPGDWHVLGAGHHLQLVPKNRLCVP